MTAPGGGVVYRSRGAEGLAPARAFVDRVAPDECDPDSRETVRAAGESDAAGFDPENDTLLFAERDGQLVGVLLIKRDLADPDAARLRWLVVDVPARNGGIGRELLFRGIRVCRERRLRVLRAWSFAASPAGPRLFWIYGFRVVDLAPVTTGAGTKESIRFEKLLHSPLVPGGA